MKLPAILPGGVRTGRNGVGPPIRNVGRAIGVPVPSTMLARNIPAAHADLT